MGTIQDLIFDTIENYDFPKVAETLSNLDDEIRGEFFRKIYQHLEHIYITGDRNKHSNIKSGLAQALLKFDNILTSPSYKKYECLVPSSAQKLIQSRIYLENELPSIEPSWLALFVGGPIGRDPIWVKKVFDFHRNSLDKKQSNILQKFLISEKIGYWLNPPQDDLFSKKIIPLKVGNGEPLKIGVMVSGQMRGYEAAFDTWTKFFQGHDVDYYVSTWKENGSSGKPDHLTNEKNRFHFGDFHDEISILLDTEGSIDLDFFMKEITPNKNISKQDLVSIYGEKCEILIEDEYDHSHLETNSQKMYYKIESAYNMIKEPGRYDLLVRIRPDIVLDFEQNGDFDLFHSILGLPAERKTICTGYGYNYAYYGFGVDDKFAIGPPNLIGTYCKTWTDNLNHKNRLAGHESLANQLFVNKIDCIGTKGILSYRFAENRLITKDIFERIVAH